jgi:hypothetical protein
MRLNPGGSVATIEAGLQTVGVPYGRGALSAASTAIAGTVTEWEPR